MAAYLEAYDLAQVSYSAGDVKEALTLFKNCLRLSPDDALLRLYIQRCTTFIEHPSQAEWTGVHVAEHK